MIWFLCWVRLLDRYAEALMPDRPRAAPTPPPSRATLRLITNDGARVA